MNKWFLTTLTAVVLLFLAGPGYAGSCKDECKQVFGEQVANCSPAQDEERCVEQAGETKEFCKFCCKHACPVCGDVNGDGVANILDAMVIGQSTVGLAELSCQ